MVTPADFVNLHTHTEYSMLDGKSKVSESVARAKELGQIALSITDHGNCYGIIEHFDECKKAGLKPILGTEFYFAEEEVKVSEEGKKTRPDFSHITVVAMNNAGLVSLNKLTTRANARFYYKPFIILKDFEEVNEGLIVTSGCMASLISQYILADKDEDALRLVKKLLNIFGDRFYIEVQDAGIPGQKKITEKLRQWSRQLNIPRFVSNDSHYARPDDFFAHSVMLAINTNSFMSEPATHEGGKRFAFSVNEFYMKDAQQISKEGWEDHEILCTRAIADRCQIEVSSKMKLPIYAKLPPGITSLDYLKKMCNDGWISKKVAGRKFGDYNARLQRELIDVEKGGIADYFLIVSDYCKWARTQNIPVGPGRGSAAGSLIAYLLDITTIDPLRYGLYWERFWNAGRVGVGLPDIDTDFSQARRGEVIEYLKETFGKDRVVPIITFNRLTTKLALKDVGRVMGVGVDEMNHITSFVPHKVESIEDAMERSPQLKAFADTQYKKVFEVAKQIQDTSRNSGKHASAIVVLDKPMDSGDIPMSYDSKSKSLITGYDMYTLDRLQYMKMDFLGLKNLDILDIAKSTINERIQSGKIRSEDIL